ncbi:MAG: hypothetical protein JKY62_01520 [Desulfocapsa sp.]|nr:hypothetical protein [Desulfocapsa sp.]MBN4060002.1 hypothetical protein [Desulfotalea psychrophila]
MIFPHRFILLVPFVFLLCSCADLNCTNLENFLGDDINLVNIGNQIADDITGKAMPPLRPRHPEDAILVSTFVNIHDLGQTSQMGMLLQSHIGSRLVQQGYVVKEVNLRNTLKIHPLEGEQILSRDLSQIDSDLSVQAILLGTYSVNNRILYITAKLVDPVKRNILSARSYRLCMDDTLLAMHGLKRKEKTPNTVQPPSESLLDKIFF